MNEFLAGLNRYLEQSPILAYIAAFFGGFLGSLTPCIYPMIPITIGVIGSQAKGGKIKAFFSSSIYVLGIATTYSTLGVISAIGGRFYKGAPLANFIMGNICILLGLSMFNVISLPSFGFKFKINPSGFIGIFFLGLASGFVFSPCITPILGVLLTYCATKKNILLAASLLFTFSLGMGLLLILVGTFTGILVSLPKPGPWMEAIKKLLAFFLIGLGEYFIFIAGKSFS